MWMDPFGTVTHCAVRLQVPAMLMDTMLQRMLLRLLCLMTSTASSREFHRMPEALASVIAFRC